MATELFRPNAAGDLTELTPQDPDFMLTNWECVAEETPDDDTTYVRATSVNYWYDTYNLPAHTGNYGAVNSVTVHVRAKKVGTSTNNIVIPCLRLGGTTLDGTAFAITTSWADYSQEISRPGGGSWTASDIDSLQAGVKCRARGVGGESAQVTQVWIVVDYTVGTHPAPTSLECERQTTPTNASDDPVFSAIWNATGSSGTATHAYVQVSEASDFSTTEWDSGWIDIADITHGTRCALIDYGGTELSSHPPNSWYYWRIKFKDASAVESTYSSYAQFKGVTRAWWNRSYAFRQKLLLNSSHGDLPADTTLRFNFKTGNRAKIATNGCFNEAIQEAGYMVAEHGDKTHVVYLSNTGTDAKYGIYIQSYNKITKLWGTPYKIDDAKTSFDTHNYPTLCIDNNGYIHVFYGCHSSPCYYRRSVVANESGAFEGDGDGGNVWTSAATIGSGLTYPQAFVVPSTNRIVLMMRGTASGYENQLVMFYSTDGGVNWSSERVIVNGSASSSYRLYSYGCRLDLNTERLHIGFSFIALSPLNMTEGAWYAYSNFDSGNADGFSLWKKANGTNCGITQTAPIVKSTADPVKLNETGNIVAYFCRNISLNRAGEPLLFWNYVNWMLDGWGQENAFGMSRWNGSAWVHSTITEDYDIKMRTDRCGLPTLVDQDDIIHTFLAVDSVIDKHHKPTANGFHTNVDVTGAASAYQAVDDGVEMYDADTTTIGKTTAAGEASFTSSATLPTGVAILAVGIDLIIRDLTGSASFTPFLRIGGTDYTATAITGVPVASGYVAKRAWWALNPATSAAWTKSEAEGVEFGIKQTVADKSWKCTRINRLIKVRYSTNEENYATEVAELTSSDSGATWSMKRLTDNSAIGVPILSIKHHYTNRQIELVWISGNDVFYLDNRPFGTMRRDARDLRLVWQGNGSSTELHRIIDYANLTNTLVEFNVPEAISSGKVAGTKDIYVYWGNLDVTSSPLSDPNDVYPLMFENFETFADNDNINGVRGWTVTTGTGTIYASPPSHNNKVFAGANSLETNYGVFAAEKSFSPALTDVLIEATIWLEDVGNRIYLQAVDSLGAVFSIGLNAWTDFATYEDGTGWHDHATIKGTQQTMCRVSLKVSASGCSAWFNGQLVASEISAITSITKIKLRSDNIAYFDMVKISRWYTTAPVIELQAEEVSGFSINSSLLGSGSDLFYVNSKLANFFVLASSLVPVENIAAYQVRSAMNSEYRGSLQTSSKMNCEFSQAFAAAIKAQIEFLAGVRAQQQLPVDTTAAVSGTSVLPTEFTATLATSQKAYVDWQSSIAIAAPLPVDSLAAAEIRSLLPLEYKGTSVIAMSLPSEYLQALSAISTMPTEHLRTTIAPLAAFVEFAGHLLVAIQMPVENRATFSTLLIMPAEWKAEVINSVSSPVEFNRLINSGAILPVESLRNIAHEMIIPVEWTGTVEMSASAKLPVEFLGSLQVSAMVPTEANLRATGNEKLILEFSGTLAVNSVAAVEWLYQTGAIARLEVESLHVLQSASAALVEILMKREGASAMPAEFVATMLAAEQLAVEWLGGQSFTMSAQIPLEWRSTINASGQMAVEELSVRTVSSLLPAESLRVISGNQKAPVEFARALAGVIGTMSIDVGRKISEQTKFPIEFGKLTTTELTTAIEFTTTLLAKAELPVEFAGAIAFSMNQALPIEWRAAISHTLSMPVESRSTIQVIGGRLLVESGRAFASSNQFALEYGQALIAAQDILAEWVGAIGASGRMSIDYVSPVSGTLTTSVEFNKHVAIQSQLNVEQLRAVIARSGLPVEWIGVFLAVLAIANARLRVPELGGALLRTPELTEAILRCAQLSNATIRSAELSAAAARIVELFKAEIRRQ